MRTTHAALLDGRSPAVPGPSLPAGFEEHAPEAYRAMLGLDGGLWLEPRLRELVEIRTAQLNGCAASLVRHAREAVEAGESQHRLAAIAHWRPSLLFTERERAALELAEALALLPDGSSLAAAHRHAAAHFGADELAQVVFACVAANAWDRLQLAADGAAATVAEEAA
jgi:AhpD family alkylhydroperoxidase